MIQFDKQMHDFGTVARNLDLSAVFTYLGSEVLNTTNFVPGCGCTGGSYDPISKTYTAKIKSDVYGTKQVSITVTVGEEKAYLAIKYNTQI